MEAVMLDEIIKNLKDDEYVLINYMEIAVNHYFPNMKKAFPGLCDCKHCTLDIKAIALNQLKPHYIVTDSGMLYSKMDEMKIQFEVDVMKALVVAITTVMNSPRHERQVQNG
jgi:competence protein ComFB